MHSCSCWEQIYLSNDPYWLPGIAVKMTYYTGVLLLLLLLLLLLYDLQHRMNFREKMGDLSLDL